MSEENIALDRAIEAMMRVIGTAEKEGEAIREEEEEAKELAEISRIAEEARSGLRFPPTFPGETE